MCQIGKNEKLMKGRRVRDGDFEGKVVGVSRQGNFTEQVKSLRRTGYEFVAAYFHAKQSEQWRI
jgi:hypothetical protein